MWRCGTGAGGRRFCPSAGLCVATACGTGGAQARLWRRSGAGWRRAGGRRGSAGGTVVAFGSLRRLPSGCCKERAAASLWNNFPRLFLVLVGVRSGAGDELVGSSCVSRRRFGEMVSSSWIWLLQTSLSFAGVCSGAGVGSVSFFKSFAGLFGFSCSCSCLSRVELQRYRDVPVAYGVFR